MMALLPASLFAADAVKTKKKGKPLPAVGEFVRFSDPTTETPIVRLTNPTSSSFLPSPANRFVSLRERSLLFTSDRTGRLAPFQADLRTGVPHQVAEATSLVPASLCLDEKEKLLYLIDGSRLQEITLATGKMRTLAEDVSNFSVGNSPGRLAVIQRGKLSFLESPGKPLADAVHGICLVRAGGKGCAFTRQISASERELWYAEDGGDKAVLLVKGDFSNPVWSPDGQAVLFLRNVPGPETLFSEIHQVSPETRVEQCVDRTSQFAAFAPNGDGTVFVGASRSKAQPNIILLLRSVQRELTLCEHRASKPAEVSPVFSPDSRRVYFQSDHEGKSAIYSVNVELLVEPTAPSS